MNPFFKKSDAALRKLLLGVATALSLTGCASLLVGNTESPPRFTLSPVEFGNISVEAPMKLRLVVADPNAEAAFETAKIAYSPQPLRYEYYPSVEWSDRAPNLFRMFLIRSFVNNGSIEAIGDRVTLPIGDYILYTDIRSFHIETRGGAEYAEISYYARLADGRNRSIASQLFTAEQPVSGAALADAIAAFNLAADEAGARTVNWALENIAVDRRRMAAQEK